jgi:hypothetical protein
VQYFGTKTREAWQPENDDIVALQVKAFLKISSAYRKAKADGRVTKSKILGWSVELRPLIKHAARVSLKDRCRTLGWEMAEDMVRLFKAQRH